jgi:hypothetical protein
MLLPGSPCVAKVCKFTPVVRGIVPRVLEPGRREE